ncbi:MAG: lipopolysaccharide heptosyltransferase, partial [Pseudomonadota bacterium]
MKILVRAPNWIGDQLMAYPFFYFLRKRYPRAQITVACVPWVADLQFRHLIDAVVVVQPPAAHQRSLWARLQLLEAAAREVRKQGPWDLGITLPNSFGSAWYLWRAGCAQRVGYSAEARRWFLTDARPWANASGLHRSQAYLNLAFSGQAHASKDSGLDGAPSVDSFWTVPAENDLDPPVRGEVDVFPAREAWPMAKTLEPPSDPYWILAPGSMADSRRWGEEQFAELAGKIARETALSGMIVGGPKEAPIAERLKQDRSLRLKDWTAQGPVPDLWRLFRDARFVVSNDSGLAHLSALMGTPTFLPWGAGEPRRTRPRGPGAVQIEVNAVACWPCEKNHCAQVGSDFLACLRGISPQQVWAQIQQGVLR